MFSTVLSAATVALVAVSSVQGLVMPHAGGSARRSHHEIAARSKDAPASYAEGYLEDYDVYHARYIALDCEDKHNSTFFDQCCHPLLATEKLSEARPAQCTPSDKALSSASAAAPTSTVKPPTDPEDCEDDDDEPAPAATTKANTSSAPPKNVQAAKPTTTSTSSSKKAAPTSTSSSAKPKETGSSGGSSGGSGSISGHATFFFQKGNAGACGTVHSDKDLVAAIPTNIFKPLGNGASAVCGKKVKVTNPANGKSVTVTAADQCPTCSNLSTDIDLSQAAFDAIADEAQGDVAVVWEFL